MALTHFDRLKILVQELREQNNEIPIEEDRSTISKDQENILLHTVEQYLSRHFKSLKRKSEIKRLQQGLQVKQAINARLLKDNQNLSLQLLQLLSQVEEQRITILSLEEDTHRTSSARCRNCGFVCVTVYHVAADPHNLECPSCHKMSLNVQASVNPEQRN